MDGTVTRDERDWRDRVTLSVPEAAAILGVGKNSGYEAAKRGDIATIRIGARLLVPVAWLRRKVGEIA